MIMAISLHHGRWGELSGDYGKRYVTTVVDIKGIPKAVIISELYYQWIQVIQKYF